MSCRRSSRIPSLVRAVAFLGLALATITSASARKKPTLPSTPAAAVDAPSLHERIDPENFDAPRLAAAIFHESNRVRTHLDLPLFGWLAKLDATADLQANSVALSQISGHVNLWPTLTHLSDRVNYTGLKPRLVAENVALLSLLQVDSARDYYRKNIDGEIVLIDRLTDLPVEPHTYATFATALVDAWMKSPGHRANLVNADFRYLGCSGRSGRSLRGFATIACVQVFYTPRGRP